MEGINPYWMAVPTLVSFSGGRTSGYMLHEIIRSHDGKLPEGVHVVFANTGKEREETLAFVNECAVRWSVPVRWVEWRAGDVGFEEVTFETASRQGEPFSALIAQKQILPNVVMRYCTQKLKIHAMAKFMRSLGYEKWNNAVGLRYDEGHRVLKQIDRNTQAKDRWHAVMPLSKAKVTKADVMSFWARQPFNLRLHPYEGNCDLCFLKSRHKLHVIMRENPGLAAWWIEQETLYAGKTRKPEMSQFNADRSYATIKDEVDRQTVFPFIDAGEEFDAECGLHCAAE